MKTTKCMTFHISVTLLSLSNILLKLTPGLTLVPSVSATGMFFRPQKDQQF